MPNHLFWTRERTRQAIELWLKTGSSESAATIMGVSGSRLRGHLSDNNITVKDLLMVNGGQITVEDLVNLVHGVGTPVKPALIPAVEAKPPAFYALSDPGPNPGARIVQPEEPRQAEPAVDASPLILVIADIHAPQVDRSAFGAVLSMMKENKFRELIILGDACELVSLSRFGGPHSMRSYKDEALEARAVLKELLALHEGPVTLIKGNHDGRTEQKVELTAPQLYGSVKDEVGFEELGVRVVPEDQQPLVRGRLHFIHGHQDMGKFPTKYHSSRMADLYGLPGHSVVYGHTHKDQVFSRPMHGGPTQAYCLGCLEKKPYWLKSADSWTHSIATADPVTGAVQVLPIRDGVLWFGTKRYAA